MTSYLHGHDEMARITRRTVARYMMFGFILILRSISTSVMKRFPTLEHIIEAGLYTLIIMLKSSKLVIQRVCVLWLDIEQ